MRKMKHRLEFLAVAALLVVLVLAPQVYLNQGNVTATRVPNVAAPFSSNAIFHSAVMDKGGIPAHCDCLSIHVGPDPGCGGSNGPPN